jgi:hypothetical protein
MMSSSKHAPTAASRRQRSRRTFLHGVGVTMALPWLESIPVWGADTPAGGSASACPKRFAAMFMGCGVNPKHWWATGSGKAMKLGPCLEALSPLTTKINVVSGLFNKNAMNVDIHPGQTGNILSGAALQKGAELKGGISVDQELARHLGEETIQPSMVLGCEQPTTGYHESNFSMAYSSHISWQSATSPVPMEVYPSLAFDALFDNQGSKRNQSILDRVRAQATRLSHRVSALDRAKLDEYLTSVREVEKRAIAMRSAKEKADAHAADRDRRAVTMRRPDNGLPEDVREHMRLMCDIIALGFQTDKTRIATLLLNRDLSGLFYPFLGVNEAHHTASHDDTSKAYEKITHFNVSQFAYLATRLDAMPEAEGTVLDHSCLLFTSSMFSGANHESSKLPVVVAGGLGGTLQTGRTLDYLKAGDDNRKLCAMYLSIMDRLGVRLDNFGDAHERLKGF